MISDLADKILGHIKLCLSHSRMIGITCDIWSTKCSKDSFLGITQSWAAGGRHSRYVSIKVCLFDLVHEEDNLEVI